MLRILTWLTLLGLVFASIGVVKKLAEINASVSQFTPATANVSNTGQTHPPTSPAENDKTATSAPALAGFLTKTFEQQCEERLAQSTVEVAVQETPTVYDYTKSIAALTTMAETTNTFTLGLTVSYPRVNVVWKIESLRDQSSGRVCMRPHFYVTVDPGTQNVYVGKEFGANTCAHKEILTHELRHVSTNKKIAKTIAKQMQQHISKSIENRVIYGKNKEELEGYVTDAIQNYWLPFAKNGFEYHKRSHKVIDTDEEYYRITNSCDGEISALVQTLEGQR